MKRSNLSKKIFLLVATMSLLVVIVYAFQSNNESIVQTTSDAQQKQEVLQTENISQLEYPALLPN